VPVAVVLMVAPNKLLPPNVVRLANETGSPTRFVDDCRCAGGDVGKVSSENISVKQTISRPRSNDDSCHYFFATGIVGMGLSAYALASEAKSG